MSSGTTTNLEYSTFSRFYQLNRHKNDNAEFEGLKIFKEISDSIEAIWCMRWSACGQLLAAGGGDNLIRIYCCHRAWKYFSTLRIKASGQHVSPTASQEREVSHNSNESSLSNTSDYRPGGSHSNSHLRSSPGQMQCQTEDTSLHEDPLLLFSVYQGHTADILDVAWSKNHFLLSSSMDKTVRLWHITRVECLCTFYHADFVSTAQFHPLDDRYFISGSLDGKVRLWNIPEKKVTMWNEVLSLPTKDNEEPTHGMITASAFVQNGKFAVIGTYDGRIIFYSTEQLKFFTQLHVGKNHEKVKITGIESVDDTKILVTTNDSRLRLYDLRDLSLKCKYKGLINNSSQIRGSVSPDSKYIVCGSENGALYLWPMYETSTSLGQRKDRNYAWECIRLVTMQTNDNSNTSGNGNSGGVGSESTSTSSNTTTNKQSRQAERLSKANIVTAVNFAPIPHIVVPQSRYVIMCADLNGTLRILSK